MANREPAYPQKFYDHVFSQIQFYNEGDPDVSGSVWYEALEESLKKHDKDETGAYIKRDPKKIISFVSRIKTSMVNDIAQRGGLNAEQKKKLSASIKLPSRSATAAMLQNANKDTAYVSFTEDLLKSIKEG